MSLGKPLELIKSKEKVEYGTCVLVANDEVIAVLCLVQTVLPKREIGYKYGFVNIVYKIVDDCYS